MELFGSRTRAFSLAAVVCGVLSAAATAYALAAGDRAPEIGLDDLAGNHVTVTALRGQVLVVAFWGSWCVPCESEMRALERLYVELRARGLATVGVSEDTTDHNVENFLRRIPVSFPIVRDADHTVARRYALGPMTTFIFDRSGGLRHIHPGFRAQDAAVIETELRALLAER